MLEQHGAFALDERGVELRMGKRIAAHDVTQKLHIGVQAHDLGLRERGVQARQRLLAGVAMHDQLGHHRVVKRADGVALAHAIVNAGGAAFKAARLWLAIDLQSASGGQEVVVGVFGANAGLDGMALDAQLVLTQRQRLATGHTQLPLDQVQASDGFGHRVLHLQAGVHLHEKELHGFGLVISRLLDDKFDCARAHIVHRFGRRHRSSAHLRTQGFGHAGGRGFFEHLLVAALHRAVALKQIYAIALRVAKHLDLDVAWALHILFDQHRIAAKAVEGFALATRERSGKVFGPLDHPHAFATATRAGFDQGRVADAVGFALQQDRVLISAVVTRHKGHTSRFHQTLGFGFEAHRQNGRCRRANEHQTRCDAGLGKVFVLAQKSIAGVHGFSACVFSGLQNAFPAQVAVFGGAATHMHRFVAGLHMLGTRISVGINRHGLNAQSASGGRHAASDFATVGDQNFFEHQFLQTTFWSTAYNLHGAPRRAWQKPNARPMAQSPWA